MKIRHENTNKMPVSMTWVSLFPQDTVDHTPAGTGNYFSHGSLSKNFFVEFKSESLKNKKVSKFQQL